MSVDQGSDAVAIGARRRTRRRWLVAGVLVVVLIDVAAARIFVSWGSPRLGQGGLIGPDGSKVATVRATFSISNEGHLPFTVYGLDLRKLGPWFAKQRVT